MSDRVIELYGTSENAYVISEKGDVYVSDPTAPTGVYKADTALSGQVRQLSGGDTLMALTNDNTLLTRGANNAGEQGTGYDTYTNALAAGNTTTTALANVLAGEAYTTDTSMTTAEDIFRTVVWADSDDGHNSDGRSQNGLSAAIAGNGSVYAWGDNKYGQLGDIAVGKDPLNENRDYKALPNEVYSLYLSVDLAYTKDEPADEADRARLVNNRVVLMMPSKGDGGNLQLQPQVNWFNVYSEAPAQPYHFYFESTNTNVVTVDQDGTLYYQGVGSAVVGIYESNYDLYTFVEVEIVPYSDT
jgi:hypothetical protein